MGFKLPWFAFALLAVVSAQPGCSSSTSCVEMGGAGELVGRAAMFRLQIYDAKATCSALSPDLMLSSTDYARNAKLSLKVKPGPQTVVLIAFADAAATIPIGRACSNAVVNSGASLCLDLTLSSFDAMPQPDLSVDMQAGSDMQNGLINHDDGYGHFWQSATPSHPYSERLAVEAGNHFDPLLDPGTESGTVSGSTYWIVDGRTRQNECVVWQFDGTGAFTNSIGHTMIFPANSPCAPPQPGNANDHIYY